SYFTETRNLNRRPRSRSDSRTEIRVVGVGVRDVVETQIVRKIVELDSARLFAAVATRDDDQSLACRQVEERILQGQRVSDVFQDEAPLSRGNDFDVAVAEPPVVEGIHGRRDQSVAGRRVDEHRGLEGCSK